MATTAFTQTIPLHRKAAVRRDPKAGGAPSSWGAAPYGWTAAQTVAAAKRHGISPELLLGVWAKETGAGQDVRTSSAGAEGNFQFLPSTAHEWNYPLTNNPTPSQFSQQADAAAAYIASLVKSHNGDQNAAILAYSGGGYTADDALNEEKKHPEKFNIALGGKVPGVQEVGLAPALDAINSVPDFLGKIGSAIFSPDWWLRVGLIVLGVVALVMGLYFIGREFVGGQVSKIIKSAKSKG